MQALVCAASPDLEPAALQHAVENANARLPDYARVRHVVRMPETPSLSNGLLTANQKLKRQAVERHYEAQIQGMYA